MNKINANNKQKTRMFILIKFYKRKLEKKDLEIFSSLGNFQTFFIPHKNYNYIEFDDYKLVDYIFFEKTGKFRILNGEKIKLFRVDKTPLDLNPPNKILLIIITVFKNNLFITTDSVLKLIDKFCNVKKVTIFQKENSFNALVDIEKLEDAIKIQKYLTELKIENYEIKSYFSDKKSIKITKIDKFNYDDDFYGKNKKFKKIESLINIDNNNFDIISNRKIISMNSLKCNEFDFDNSKDETDKYCLYLINVYDDYYKSKENFNFQMIFNIFSLYGNVIKISFDESYKRGLIYYESENHYNTAFKLLQQISIDILFFKILKPNTFNEYIHKAFLINENLNIYHEKIKKLEENENNDKKSTFKENKKIKNKKEFLYFEFKKQIKNNKTIIISEKYNKENQRKDIFTYKRENYPSNYLILKKLSNNFNLLKLKNKILENFDEDGKKRIQPVFLILTKLNKNQDHILICYSLEVSLNVIKYFHNFRYEDRELNINFASKRIIEKFQNNYQVKINWDVPKYFLNNNDKVSILKMQIKSNSDKKDIRKKKVENNKLTKFENKGNFENEINKKIQSNNNVENILNDIKSMNNSFFEEDGFIGFCSGNIKEL